MCSTVQLSRFLSFWQLWYSIISFLACQELFQKVFSAIQLSRSFFDSYTRLSHLHRFVKNFLKLFYRPKSSFKVSLSLTATFIDYHIFNRLSTTFQNFFCDSRAASGERGIWTLARREPSTPLAGAPLQPLEYFSNAWISNLFNLPALCEQNWLYLTRRLSVNHFFTFFLLFYFRFMLV